MCAGGAGAGVLEPVQVDGDEVGVDPVAAAAVRDEGGVGVAGGGAQYLPDVGDDGAGDDSGPVLG